MSYLRSSASENRYLKESIAGSGLLESFQNMTKVTLCGVFDFIRNNTVVEVLQLLQSPRCAIHKRLVHISGN